MALTTCELVWLKSLLGELGVIQSEPMKLFYDNQAALHIASNPMFHERTKHIEMIVILFKKSYHLILFIRLW